MSNCELVDQVLWLSTQLSARSGSEGLDCNAADYCPFPVCAIFGADSRFIADLVHQVQGHNQVRRFYQRLERHAALAKR